MGTADALQTAAAEIAGGWIGRSFSGATVEGDRFGLIAVRGVFASATDPNEFAVPWELIDTALVQMHEPFVPGFLPSLWLVDGVDVSLLTGTTLAIGWNQQGNLAFQHFSTFLHYSMFVGRPVAVAE